MPSKGKYIYCIIKEKDPKKFDILGQEGKMVYTINQGDLAAVVSNSPIKEYPLWREHINAHQKTIEEIMKRGYDVLPVKFSTIAESAQDVKEKILKREAKRLEKEYEKIKDKVELNLKVFWKDMPAIFKEIADGNPNIRAAKTRAQKGKLPFNEISKMGEMVEADFKFKRAQESEKILSYFKKLATGYKEKEILESPDLMRNILICDNAFLVPKENEKKFDKTVANLSKRGEKRFKFLYVGPIAPYNFVELHLNVKKP